MKFTKEEIGAIDGARTALALCGHIPFGDCQSIRIRLASARGHVVQLTKIIDQLAKGIPDDEYIAIWKREVEIWEYAIKKGEALLAKELAKLDKETTCPAYH